MSEDTDMIVTKRTIRATPRPRGAAAHPNPAATRARVALAVAFALALTGGCRSQHGSPGEPALQSRSAAESDSAATCTLVALPQAYITRIDGANVPSGDKIRYDERQVIRARPGHRRVTAYTTGPAGSASWKLQLKLVAGHEYTFAPASPTAISLRVVDTTTGEVLHGAGLAPPPSSPRPAGPRPYAPASPPVPRAAER